MRKVLLLGIGGDLVGDAGVAKRIVRYFEKLDLQLFDVKYTSMRYLQLFENIRGYEKVIIVKTLDKSGKTLESCFYEKDDYISTYANYSLQESTFIKELLDAEKTFPDMIPNDIKLIAIEIPVDSNYSNRLTKQTKKLAFKAILQIYSILESFEIKIYVKETNYTILD